MSPGGGRPLTLVAAVARNGVIGAGGAIPWRLPGDQAHFRAFTLGHPLLMGRATYESIGRPLPGRATTVMSRNPALVLPGVVVASDLAGALASAERQADTLEAATIMVVGGAEIYAQTIDLADTLLITEVAAEPDGDTLFPPIDPRRWRRTVLPAPERRADDACGYRFVRWRRRPPP